MTTVQFAQTKYRIESIDLVRGLIMLFMAIDHTRDFFHVGSPDPSNLTSTTPILFFTRWITHFCAALFVFLSGVSVNLAGTRRTKKELSLFLLKRGLWLIAVEFILITFAITLDPLYRMLIFQVIWVIGVSMILMAGLVWLPLRVIAAIGVLLFFGHNILDYVTLPTEGAAGFFWKLFFTAFGFFYQLDSGPALLVLYAILPWTGVMLLGYVMGQVYHTKFDAKRRKQLLLGSGLGLIALFLIFRLFTIYGDPNPWKEQTTAALTIISFFNVSKYPPSLMYLCMTIGPGLVLLATLEKVKNAFSRVLIIYGNVPFFYYVLHFYLLRVLNILLFYVQGYTSVDIASPQNFLLFKPNDFGFNLLGVYAVWLTVITLLYFPCRWFSKYKKTHQQWWLSYL